MLHIDGSVGEGGGQIIRTAIALAAITGTEVEIANIRANRPKPGLSAQHLHAVKAVARLADGQTEGLALRSTRLTFAPGPLKGFEGTIDIGTAGSITLLLQCLIPVTLFADRATHVRITGGTDVAWSPPIDFYTQVFLPALKEMGCDVHLDVLQRGYYPQGGGVVDVTVQPVKQLKGFLAQESKRVEVIGGISHSCGLPAHVAERQANAANRLLRAAGYHADLKTEIVEKSTWTTGCGITLWCGYKGGSALGERGKRAEVVGEEAARNLTTELQSSATVDVHLADQLVPYTALADGPSELRVRAMTMHLETNLYITQQFLDVAGEIGQERTDGEAVFVIRKV
ncbi:MAG TPA: RNA 3'-terminal phosphate cyclase [Methanomicrobia archaeon]|nr:RNA 3'-terminal phosphate cyclase [Methanomicrobia archaeon]